MSEFESFLLGKGIDAGELAPDLEELCRVHDVSMELIARSHDLDDLLDLLLDEYERRLAELPNDAFDDLGENQEKLDEDPKLRALVMFAAQATALKAKAESATRVRRHAEELEVANDAMRKALRRAESNRKRLRGVMEALNAGILILDRDCRVLDTNRAACEMIGSSREDLQGRVAAPYLGQVERRSEGEVHGRDAEGNPRTWLMTRCDLQGETGEEVALFGDVTERDRATRERYESEKVAEVLQAVAVLAHKINNPLTALMGRAQLLGLRASDDPKIQKATQVIEESAVRISELIKELARVAKFGSGEELRVVLDRMNPAKPSGEEES